MNLSAYIFIFLPILHQDGGRTTGNKRIGERQVDYNLITSLTRWMSNDLTNKEKGDDARIDINQAKEVAYWSNLLGVSIQLLRNAILATGPVVRDVKAYLQKHSRKN